MLLLTSALSDDGIACCPCATVMLRPRLYNHSTKGMMCQLKEGSPERIQMTSWQSVQLIETKLKI